MPNDSSDTTDDDNETIGNLERSSHSAEEQPDVTDGMSDEDRTDTNIGSYAEPDGNIELTSIPRRSGTSSKRKVQSKSSPNSLTGPNDSARLMKRLW